MRVFGPRRDAVWADYLAWERGLAQRVVADPAVRFRFFDERPQCKKGTCGPRTDR
ncbi:hypothetical protein [Variovorax sp. KK3]|nr:hypothetical protein [Variovorax sp. KK3]